MEDLITSAVFGPLMYMGDASRIFFNLMMDKAGFKNDGTFFQDDEDIQIIFWPKLPRSGVGRRHVEPDIVVIGNRGENPNILIIEIKWNAHLGLNQLRDQWDARHRCAERAKLSVGSKAGFRQLLLVRNRHHDDLQQLDKRRKKSDVRLLTWHDISELTTHGAGKATPWARDVKDFLRKLGVRTQVGWASVALEEVDCISATFSSLPCLAQMGWGARSLEHVSFVDGFYVERGKG